MDEAGFLRVARGEARGPGAAMMRGALAAVSAPYRAGVAIRNLAFDRGWKRIHRAEVPVVSIGNLTLGGTGKTPAVEWVARRLREQSLRVAILSRGYGGDSGLNDEGLVLEENLPDVPHLQGRDRAALARVAVEELASQILVLDDGFQHRRLRRGLDIVLLDALEPFGLGWMFPRGLLREPIGSLNRADLVILSRADLVPESRRTEIRREAERRAGQLRWVEARHAPRDLMVDGGDPEPFDRLSDAKVAAFCGIGNPEGFRRTLETLRVSMVGFRAFPDHHGYGAADVADLGRWAETIGADLLLTTQKDSVKLRAPALGRVHLRALRIGLDVISGRDVLDEALAVLIRNPST